MREILFRGKRTDNGQWVYGTPIPYSNGTVLICREYKRNENVNQNTVGQYTGLTDKNGIKIFEGDIVKHIYDNRWPDYYDVGAVFYSDEKASFFRTVEGHKKPWHMRSDCIYEVIGNIYDNPELLEANNG